jgi:glycosyltransferase involved in cell wall biosynthesis
MSYFPNSDAALYFLDNIHPLIVARIPSVRVQIVGADPPRCVKARANPSVEITGRVPRVEPYYAQAAVFIVPMRCGGGTRVKVLEAMAHGVPVVSTTVGSEGLSVRHDDSVLLADTPESFANATVRLCTDEWLARRIAANGRELVRTEYDWRRIGESVASILEGVAHR